MTHVKDIEQDKIKSIESKKDAEIKMQEKLIEGFKRDKRELEERIEDLLAK